LVCEAVGGAPHPARPAAAAVELIHNFSLLHDDIEDQSPTRRGRPTAWAIWGPAQAINAGDTLFTLAFLAVPRLTLPGTDPALTNRMWSILGDTCLELTRGQHLDMSFEAQDGVSTEEYLHMIRGKTAALLAGSASLGALAGGADEETLDHYRAFGESLGLAFQVIDDTLDIWGDPELTGKEPAVDIRQRKKSLPVLYGLARSDDLRMLYGQEEPFSDSEVDRAVALLDEVGARAFAEDLARQYTHDTLHSLEAAEPDGPAGEGLHQLVHMLLHRDH
jgi:geranylgeranyl diphosphate synthase type I